MANYNNATNKRSTVEFNRIIFNAASDGQLYRLKVFLDDIPKEEKAASVSALTCGCTPLIVASCQGHLEVASYLIEECYADVEQTVSVVFKDETIEGASPLWCVAGAGRLDLVKLLLKHKASINSVTKSNSTPLSCACFEDFYEIVKYLIQQGANIEIANNYGHTCLMIACHKGFYKIAKYLIECGADVNRKSNKGKTALHDCVVSGNLPLLKLLLKNGAIFLPDSAGVTPLISAALLGRVVIVEYFLKNFNCTEEEKINALELSGATFIDKKLDLIMGHELWLQATTLRYQDLSCPIKKPETSTPLSSIVNITEFKTLSELEDLILDPHKMRLQSLLVRERILGLRIDDNFHYICKRGEEYAENGDFETCIKLWMYALNAQQKEKEPLSKAIHNSLLSFVDLFSYMMVWNALAIDPPVFFSTIFHVFEKALYDIERVMNVSQKQNQQFNRDQFHCFLTVTLHLVDLMCRYRSQISESQESKFKETIYRLVNLNPRGRKGQTLLHIACSNDKITASRFSQNGYRVPKLPSVAIVNLLLEAGASPDVLDFHLNTPLHIVTMNKPLIPAIFSSLLSHGSHLDQCNNKKQTPFQLVQHTPPLDIHLLQYVNLQCLSAKVVQSHKIPYKGLVPIELEKFVDLH